MRKILRSKRGEGYIDVCIIMLVVIMILALFTAAAPVMTAKMQLDNFADELVREAEISGRIGAETTSRARVISEKTGLSPKIEWSRNGKIPLNQEFTVTLTVTLDIGFGGFGSFPVTLTSKASGKSEVYWK
ncbi:MAG: DUF4320 family protein [Oscillospiraceae bacterium]